MDTKRAAFVLLRALLLALVPFARGAAGDRAPAAAAHPASGAALAPTTAAPPGSQTFSYTGGLQTFTVPAGVTALTIQATGAAGGTVDNGRTTGGRGATITGDFAVTPGQQLTILAAGAGASYVGGVGGAGGGGGSFVWAGEGFELAGGQPGGAASRRRRGRGRGRGWGPRLRQIRRR